MNIPEAEYAVFEAECSVFDEKISEELSEKWVVDHSVCLIILTDHGAVLLLGDTVKIEVHLCHNQDTEYGIEDVFHKLHLIKLCADKHEKQKNYHRAVIECL